MADDPPKPSIPAWQQAATTDTTKEVEQSAPTTDAQKDSPVSSLQTTIATPNSALTDEEAFTSDPTPHQREQIRKFLQDPAVVNGTSEEKRAFLLSKDIPAHLIDQELGEPKASSELSKAEFNDFQGQNSTTLQSEHDVQAPPPIITYPEFLSNAHRPAPLITPGRILASTYVASAAAVLLWSASTYLVKPMTAALTDARHDLIEHSQDKVKELNTKLEKVVSEVPHNRSTEQKDSSDAESVASDPTELYHRDIGTQTDSSARVEITPNVTLHEMKTTTQHVESLGRLHSHLKDMLSGLDKQGDATKDRQDHVSKLRHQLDTMTYGSAGINVWNHNGTTFGETSEQKKKEDAIDDLKKEIRGVKGVLLSAKRFPALGTSQAQAGTRYSARRQVDAPS